jgi:hypothetical protein
MSHLRYLCLFMHSGVQHILCCVFALFFFVLCILCFQFLWIVLLCLPLRYSLTFMYNVPLHIYSLPKLWHLVQRHTCRPDFGLVKSSRNSSHIDNFSVKCFVIIPRGYQGLKKHNILIFIIMIVKIDYISITIIWYILSLLLEKFQERNRIFARILRKSLRLLDCFRSPWHFPSVIHSTKI